SLIQNGATSSARARIQRCCHVSRCRRGSPLSPALPPHLLSGKPHLGRRHQLWPGAPSPTALAPSPSPQDRSSPPGSQRAERIYLHISTFVPGQRPISARGQAKGLGGAPAPAPAPAQLRRPQVPERVRAAAGAPRTAAPGSGPPPASALLPRLGQAPKTRTKRLSGKLRRSLIYVRLLATTGSKMVCGGFACSKNCLCALNLLYTGQLLEVGWNNTASARNDIQRNLNCCGFRSFNPNDTCPASCVKSDHPCSPCAPIIGEYAGEVLRFVGGIGLFFSFTEILGVWLTYRYRNQKDPRANPSAFL
uniref:Tetraspanin 13 n=1 Tax=Callithrix jacchus TaxID=9483 RepID=A0A5F4WF73_CALJA